LRFQIIVLSRRCIHVHVHVRIRGRCRFPLPLPFLIFGQIHLLTLDPFARKPPADEDEHADAYRGEDSHRYGDVADHVF